MSTLNYTRHCFTKWPPLIIQDIVLLLNFPIVNAKSDNPLLITKKLKIKHLLKYRLSATFEVSLLNENNVDALIISTEFYFVYHSRFLFYDSYFMTVL
jgi:hypothetical protein